MLLDGFLPFDAAGVIPGAVAEAGRKAVCQAGFVAFARDAFDPLQAFHQQWQAAGRDNVAGDLGRIHALHSGARFQARDLGIRDLFVEGACPGVFQAFALFLRQLAGGAN